MKLEGSKEGRKKGRKEGEKEGIRRSEQCGRDASV
jgi:hypothetical protein